MRIAFTFLITTFCFFSCRESAHNETNVQKIEKDEVTFFPVTDYFKGQILNIKEKGITPLRFSKINNKTDSTWIPWKDVEASLSEFLFPVMDSTFLAPNITSKKFFDQTLNAITLTYESSHVSPDKQPWMSWNVYINPEKGLVERIYLEKLISPSKKIQLLWIPNKYCKQTTVVDENQKGYVEKEVIIKWDY